MKLWRSTDADIQGYIIRIDRCHQLQERPKKMHWRHGLRGMKLKGKRCHRCHQSPAGFWSGLYFTTRIAFLRHFWLFYAFWVISCLKSWFLSYFLVSRPVFKGIFKVRLLFLSLLLLKIVVFDLFLTIYTCFWPKTQISTFVLSEYITGDTGDNWWHSEDTKIYILNSATVENPKKTNRWHNWWHWWHLKKPWKSARNDLKTTSRREKWLENLKNEQETP